jgi:hypothetical protein
MFTEVSEENTASISTVEQQTKQSDVCLLLTSYLIGLLFDIEDGGNTWFRNVCERLPDYIALFSTTQYSSQFNDFQF